VKCTPVTPLAAIQARAGLDGDTVTYDDGSDLATAAAAAAQANVAIVFGYYTESEGTDRTSLALDGSGNALIGAVAGANRNTIVVLNTGGPALMPWLSQVSAVLEAWYPGQENGNALAPILFGDVSPSGKLSETFPAQETDLPTAGSPAQYPGVPSTTIPGSTEATYSEELDVGYRWYDDHAIAPMFPFGFGLSYTTFSYSNLAVSPAPTPGSPATVDFDVTNTGSRAGAEVAEVYVGAPSPNPVSEPQKQLRGFQKLLLQPAQSAHVSLPIDSRAVSFWNATSHGWQPEVGCHPVLVGSSSRDIRLQGAGVDGSLGVCPASAVIVPEGPTAALPAVAGLVVLISSLAAVRRRTRFHGLAA
jgi:beta-glucosidase